MSLSGISNPRPLPPERAIKKQTPVRFSSQSSSLAAFSGSTTKASTDDAGWVTYFTKSFQAIFDVLMAPFYWLLHLFFPNSTKTETQESAPREVLKEKPTPLQSSEKEHVSEAREHPLSSDETHSADSQEKPIKSKKERIDPFQQRKTRLEQQGKRLFRALRSRDSRHVKAVLAEIPESDRADVIMTAKVDSTSLLHEAARHRQSDIMQILLDAVPKAKRGAVAGYADPDGITPLHWAAMYKNVQAAKALLNAVPKAERASLVRQPDTRGCTPFGQAVSPYHAAEMVQLLLDAVPKPEQAALVYGTKGVLVNATKICGNDDLETLQILLNTLPVAERVTLINNSVVDDGYSLLSNAVALSDRTLIQVLLNVVPEADRGKLVTHSDRKGFSPLIRAVKYNSPMVPYLLNPVPKADRAALITHVDPIWGTPFLQAVSQSHPQVAQTLLDVAPYSQRAAIVNHADRYGNTVVHHASPQVIPLLMKHGATTTINQPNHRGHTPLQCIELNAQDETRRSQPTNDLKEAGLLIAYGADPTVLSEPFRKAVMAHMDRQNNKYSSYLVNSDDYATVREAMQWFQQFPPGGGALNWKPSTKQCNRFLEDQLEQLKQASVERGERKMALQILGRCRPILRSGVPVNLNTRDALLEKAREIGYIDIIKDAIVANPDYSTCSELINLVKKNDKSAVPLQ